MFTESGRVVYTQVGKLYSASTLALFLSDFCSWDGSIQGTFSEHLVRVVVFVKVIVFVKVMVFVKVA
jgi:hypothetical protein